MLYIAVGLNIRFGFAAIFIKHVQRIFFIEIKKRRKSAGEMKLKSVLKKIYLGAVTACVILGIFSYINLENGKYVPEGQNAETASEGNPEAAVEKDAAETAPEREGVETAPEKESPKVAITFDDGPHVGTTEELLDGLKERNVKASFFLIGSEIEGEESVVKRMKQDGHLIGNHTWSHVQLTTLSDDAASRELIATNEEIALVTGEKPDFMRPPFGTISQKVEKKTEMIPILWSVDSLDWTTSNSDEIVNRVVTKVKDGDIILLHDCYESSVDAALRIIDLLAAEGYEFVTADELITD